MTRQYGRGLTKKTLFFTPEIIAALAKLPSGEVSEFVRRAIEEKLQKLQREEEQCANTEQLS